MIKIDRTNTDFSVRLFEYLKSTEIKDPRLGFLKYHQAVVRTFLNNIDIGAKGLLVYHSMGMGKTLIGVIAAMDRIDKYKPIVLLSKSLQENFKKDIKKYIQLRKQFDPGYTLAHLNDDEIEEFINEKFSFVSMNASNMIDQIVAAAEGQISREYKKMMKRKEQPGEKAAIPTSLLDGKLLIVDEAHNLFRAITNGSKNGSKLYELIMSAKNLIKIFLTGTPIANDPFEIVPCFNMLAGMELFPDMYRDFNALFVDRANHRIKNKEKFQNRIMGLVSHVSHLSRPGAGIGADLNGLSVEFPEELPTRLEFVPMDPEQYVIYQLAREKEKEEGKGSSFGPPAPVSLQKPRGKSASSYRQRSRQISNFALNDANTKYSDIDVYSLPDEKINSPKFRAIMKNIDKSPGVGYVYSQFVGAGGLGSFMRFLEINGWSLYSGQTKQNINSAIHEESSIKPSQSQDEEIIGEYEYRSMRDLNKSQVSTQTNRYNDITQSSPVTNYETSNRSSWWYKYISNNGCRTSKINSNTCCLGGSENILTPSHDIKIIKKQTSNNSYSVVAHKITDKNEEEICRINYTMLMSGNTPVDVFVQDVSISDKSARKYIINLFREIEYTPVHSLIDLGLFDGLESSVLCDAGGKKLYRIIIKEFHNIDIHSNAKLGAAVNKRDLMNSEFACSRATGGFDTPAKKSKKFAFITGAVPTETRQMIQNIFNSEENKNGGVIDLILLSSTGAEGLDLKNVRHEHIMEPYWNYARISQIKARGIRNDAHKALPKEDRNVRVFIYLSVKPISESGGVNYDNMVEKFINEPEEVNLETPTDSINTTDIELYVDSIKGRKIVDSYETALKEVCLECAINGESYCRLCDPNNSILFYKDLDRDMKLQDPCMPVKEKKIVAKSIIYDGVEYNYTQDNSSVFGYRVFTFDKNINKHVQMHESNPIFMDLIEKIKSAQG